MVLSLYCFSYYIVDIHGNSYKNSAALLPFISRKYFDHCSLKVYRVNEPFGHFVKCQTIFIANA